MTREYDSVCVWCLKSIVTDSTTLEFYCSDKCEQLTKDHALLINARSKNTDAEIINIENEQTLSLQ